MLSYPTRCVGEIPAAIDEREQAEAQGEGSLITDEWDAHAHHGRAVNKLHEAHIELERLRGQLAALGALAHSLAEVALLSPAPQPEPPGHGSLRPAQLPGPPADASGRVSNSATRETQQGVAFLRSVR